MRRLKMKTFTIDGNNQILVFASKKEAAATSATDAFTNQDELGQLTAEWPMHRLVGLWNGLSGVNPVSRFTSRKIAVECLWKAIQELEVSPKPEPTVPETTVAEASVPAESVPEPDAATIEAQEVPSYPVLPAIELQSPVIEEPQVVPAKKARKASQKAKTQQQDSGPREGSKTAQVVAMLERKDGATISEIMHAMGWQKHTVRGFMAGTMKKAGYTVESFKPEGGERRYRIQK
jgi:hypothetical protein